MIAAHFWPNPWLPKPHAPNGERRHRRGDVPDFSVVGAHETRYVGQTLLVKVLLIENHQVFARTVVDLFLKNHSVTVVPTVMEALDTHRAAVFDVVLLDYDLDDFKGDVFLKRVRARGDTIPVVAISAKPDGNAALLAAGANTVCQKADFHAIAKILDRLASCP